MKKLPIIISVFAILSLSLFFSPSSSFAVCIMPPGYNPGDDPEINLDLSSWEETGGWPDQFPLEHETDPKAPQLGTLIEGICNLEINSVNMISGTDRPPMPDIPADYANLVCISTPAGQAVLVPNSGYNMGGGCEAVVLYATSHSIVLKYTPDDNIVSGYTVYINNLQVDSNLLAYYNQQHNSGRAEMPCLSGGEKIGVSSGETCVAIRDTGTFMDPRWSEWWQQCSATARELILKLIALCLGGVLPPDFFPPGSLTCTPDLIGDQDSRPYYNIPTERACDLCNLTGLFCPSCATSFTVHDAVSYRRGDGTPEPPHCVETPWGGTVVINPTETKIPFVGKKGEENEQRYLADYFEGTNEYYEDYPMYWRDWINYAGVWRKLSPMGYQDQLKKQMVERALATSDVQPEGVHHYQLEYRGRICWDMPLLMDAFLAYAESRGISLIGSAIRFVYERSSYCSFEGSIPGVTVTKAAIDTFNAISPLDITYFHTTDASGKLTSLEGHYPPDPFEEDYAEKWNEWKESGGGWWYKLWQVVPMFSHEDTPGQIAPYLGYKSKDIPKFIPPKVEKVPHVARLYEATQEVQNMLVPSYNESLTLSQEQSEPIIASAKENVLGEKTLLAQDGGCQECPELSIANPGVSNGMIYYTYQLCPSCSGHGVIGDVFVGACGRANQMHNIPPSCFSSNHPAITPPVPISCPGTANICIAFKCDSCSGCPGQWITKSCQVTVDESCNITDTNCGTVPVAPAVCGVSGPMPVMECEMEAITDTNENDNLCCGTIDIDLHAVDAFENPEYDKCREEGITCNPPGCTPGVDCITCRDPCNRLVERSVNRRFGINLLHPYLTDIWEQTGLAKTAGIFNFFRLEDEKIPKFREIDASSEITYSYHGGVTPSTGKFYFNYLGGVQLAKEWVTRALMPWKE